MISAGAMVFVGCEDYQPAGPPEREAARPGAAVRPDAYRPPANVGNGSQPSMTWTSPQAEGEPTDALRSTWKSRSQKPRANPKITIKRAMSVLLS
jgi:hypothetical protein